MVTTRSGTKVGAQTAKPSAKQLKRKNSAVNNATSTTSSDTLTEPATKILKTDVTEDIIAETKLPPAPAPTPATPQIASTTTEASIVSVAPAPIPVPAVMPVSAPTVDNIPVLAADVTPAVPIPASTSSVTLTGTTVALEDVKEPSPEIAPMPDFEAFMSQPATSIATVPAVTDTVGSSEVTVVQTEAVIDVPTTQATPAATAPAPAPVAAPVDAPSSVEIATVKSGMPTEFHEKTPTVETATAVDGGITLNVDPKPALVDEIAVSSVTETIATPVVTSNMARNPLNLKTEHYFDQVSETLAGIDSAVAAARAQPSMIANGFGIPPASQAQQHSIPSSDGGQSNYKSPGAFV
ncbi:hypothetical protein BGZ76_001161 [Entomortierella beljakovae]|nr:hypothetical protein BGZ76_001161 [Entomortierella beljakovae]